MKTKRMLLAITLLPLVLLTACGTEKVAGKQVDFSQSALVKVEGSSCVTLLAGQTINVGEVCASVEGDNLKVTYQTMGGWSLYEAHLWAGLNLADMPQTKSGNPKVGNFPYNSGVLDGVTTFSFLVPLSTFGMTSDMVTCDDVTGYLVAHAVVKKMMDDGTMRAETAYGEGTRLVSKGNWATWFSVTLSCGEDEPKVATCETAFAYGGPLATCFLDSGLINANRWGWYNGPLGAGSYTMDIYAGAGQCDLGKGTHVGSLSVLYDGAIANVTYDMSPGFTMDETHLYVGGEPLPRKNGEYTVAPGQYGNIHDLTSASSDSYTISGLSGDIFVTAHAVACSNQWP